MPTKLGPLEESNFIRWYRDWADRTKINPNPDDPLHFYDYRAAFVAKESPKWDEELKEYHWSSAFKSEDHPRRVLDGIDTSTGEQVDDINYTGPLRRK